MSNPVYNALIGVAIGDALGVPVEFKSREDLETDPVIDMRGYGTYNQRKGTWSDDTSLTLALADALLEDYSLLKIAQNFIMWFREAKWSARGKVFDIGHTTADSIELLENMISRGQSNQLQKLKERGGERTNGNGSLMRIIPLLFYIKGMPSEEQFHIIWENSALTHYHIRAAIACFFYLKIGEALLKAESKHDSYEYAIKETSKLFDRDLLPVEEKQHFERVLNGEIEHLEVSSISSGGYVIESLEASLWCFLNETSYSAIVLKAVNLGSDTDTTAAIAGGLAGLHYSAEQIPNEWLRQVAKHGKIERLSKKLSLKFL